MSLNMMAASSRVGAAAPVSDMANWFPASNIPLRNQRRDADRAGIAGSFPNDPNQEMATKVGFLHFRKRSAHHPISETVKHRILSLLILGMLTVGYLALSVSRDRPPRKEPIAGRIEPTYEQSMQPIMLWPCEAVFDIIDDAEPLLPMPADDGTLPPSGRFWGPCTLSAEDLLKR
jgi:hypothetical protein